MIVKSLLLLAALLPGATQVFADAPKLQLIHSWKDVQLYTKTKYDLVRNWDQEIGFQSTVAKFGNLRESLNICYDPVYPIKFNTIPRFAIGAQTTYVFAPGPLQPGIYTKTKSNFLGQWKQETGFTFRLYTSRSFFITSNVAWLFTYPFNSSAKPQWLWLATLAIPLG